MLAYKSEMLAHKSVSVYGAAKMSRVPGCVGDIFK